MRYSPERQDRINQGREIVKNCGFLSKNGKLVTIHSKIRDISTKELMEIFHPFPHKAKRNDPVMQALRQLHELNARNKVYAMENQFRKSIESKGLVVRTVVNPENQFVRQNIKTKEEYEKYNIAKDLNKVIEGIKESMKIDKINLELSEQERKELVKQQLLIQKRKIQQSSEQ